MQNGVEAPVALVYELLDAHEDTVRLAMAGGLGVADASWSAHLDYLRALQRLGHEALARVAENGP